MSQLTLPDLVQILRECAGESDAVSVADQSGIGDMDVDALGYDSLALMEAAARVSRRFGIDVPEDEMADIRTLNEFVTIVNRLMEAAVPRGAQ
ncbi:acyl carrier protein [Spirillospora sp. NBC_00431]